MHKNILLNQILTNCYREYQDWLETIDLRNLSNSSMKIDARAREVLRGAHHLFADVHFTDDAVVIVDLGSGQTIRVSKKDLEHRKLFVH